MWARVSRLMGSREQIDDLLRNVRETVIPALKQMAGFQGAYFLVDRSSGASMSVTLWESEDALQASEEAANKLRGDAAQAAAAGTPVVERYEVAERT